MQHDIKFNLFDAVKDLEKERNRIYKVSEIANKTGLSRRTITLLMEGETTRIELKTINKLLDFFHAEGMPILVADLFDVKERD